MFEITIAPALSVLPVQHELFLDGTMLELGHTSDGPPPPPPRQLWINTELNLGQTGSGPLPPPPR